jgi:hypothetical protein
VGKDDVGASIGSSATGGISVGPGSGMSAGNVQGSKSQVSSTTDAAPGVAGGARSVSARTEQKGAAIEVAGCSFVGERGSANLDAASVSSSVRQ